MATRREVVLGVLLGLLLSAVTGVFKGVVSSGATGWITLAAIAEYCVAVALLWFLYPLWVRKPFGARQVFAITGLLGIKFGIGFIHSWITESIGVKAQPAYMFSWIFAFSVVAVLRQDRGDSAGQFAQQSKSEVVG